MAKDQREIRRMIQRAQNAGWRVEMRKHWRLYPTDKRFKPITIAGTPSDNYAVENARNDLRAAGLDV